MEGTKKSKVGLIVLLAVVLGGPVLLFCGGILAAIAIPAFSKYANKSKASEAQIVARQMASYAQMRFEQDCKFPPNLTSTIRELDKCCGGAKCPSGADPKGEWASNVPGLTSPSWFGYFANNTANGNMIVGANADFQCGAKQTSVTIEIKADKASCTAEIMPPRTRDEF